MEKKGLTIAMANHPLPTALIFKILDFLGYRLSALRTVPPGGSQSVHMGGRHNVNLPKFPENLVIYQNPWHSPHSSKGVT